jgi:hypothetical protein
MKFTKLFVMGVMLTAMLNVAQAKPKKNAPVSAAFQNARFVYVQAEDGDVMRPGLYPADRKAILDVEDGIRDWSRYVVTTQREHADLVVVVRKGRTASAQGNVGVAVGPPSRPGSQGAGLGQGQGRDPSLTGGEGDSIGGRAELGPSDDSMRIFMLTPEGKRMGPIWMREMTNGLDGPSVMLLQQLKEEVERAYPPTPPAKQPTP